MLTNYVLPASIDQEKAVTILIKVKYAFAAVFSQQPQTATTDEVASYYEVAADDVLDILNRHFYEFERDLRQDDWTPKAILRLGLLINCPIGSLVRDTALNIIEAVAKTSVRAKIKSLFTDIEFVGWSNREIAKILECSKDTVRITRQELEKEGEIPTSATRRVKRGEVIYELDKSNHLNCKEMYPANSSQMSHSSTGDTGEESDCKEMYLANSSQMSHDNTNITYGEILHMSYELPSTTENDYVKQSGIVTVSSQSHSRYGQTGVIAAEPPNHWQQIVEFPDGSRELIRNNELDAGSVDYPQKTYTLTEAELQTKINCAIEEAKLGFLTELEAVSRAKVQEFVEAKDALIAQLRSRNYQLQQQIEELEGLRQLEIKNSELIEENERLKDAAQQSALSTWDHRTIFNKQAAKVLNKETKAYLESLEPHLHLRAIAEGAFEDSDLDLILDLIGKAINRLSDVGLEQYRRHLIESQTWGDFEPITSKWIAIKHNLWAELTKVERQRITDLKNAPPPAFKVGDRVTYLGDSFDAQYGCSGEVLGMVFQDFKIRWHKNDGKTFESRHSTNEIQLEAQYQYA